MNLKSMFTALMKKTFLDKDGNISTMKTGAAIAGAGAAILGVPTMVAAIGVSGLVVVLPVAVATGAKIAVGLGTYISALGARDAMDKNGPVKPE
jgi:hypothetical protein